MLKYFNEILSQKKKNIKKKWKKCLATTKVPLSELQTTIYNFNKFKIFKRNVTFIYLFYLHTI